MRLLAVAIAYPFPPGTGGTLVAYHHLRLLARRHAVRLVCPGEPRPTGELGAALEGVDFVPPREAGRVTHLLRALRGALAGTPPTIAEYHHPGMRRCVARRLGEGGWDALLLFDVRSIQYCPPESRRRAVVNVEDPQSVRLPRLRMLQIWTAWQRAKLALLGRLTARYERRTFPGLGRVLMLSEADAADLGREGGHRNLGWVGYGVEPVAPATIPGLSAREPGALVVSGNMFHGPNVDGVLWLLRHVLPRILLQEPGATLWVVGADPDPRIVSAAAPFGPRVRITGRVDDVSAYLRRSLVSLCPVQLRIGVQTKVLEAMAWGTPVVTTEAGNSGVGGVPGAHLWVEDEPDGFARRAVELLRGRGWEQLSGSGAALVRSRFTWEQSAAQLERHLEAVGGARS